MGSKVEWTAERDAELERLWNIEPPLRLAAIAEHFGTGDVAVRQRACLLRANGRNMAPRKARPAHPEWEDSAPQAVTIAKREGGKLHLVHYASVADWRARRGPVRETVAAEFPQPAHRGTFHAFTALGAISGYASVLPSREDGIRFEGRPDRSIEASPLGSPAAMAAGV